MGQLSTYRTKDILSKYKIAQKQNLSRIIMLSEHLLTELKQILFKNFGLSLSDKEVKDMGLFLLSYFEILIGADNE